MKKILNLIEYKKKKLFEIGLSRLWSHQKNKTLGIISAHKDTRTFEENTERDKKLRNMIESNKNYGYVRVLGYWWDEKGEEKQKEYSFFIFAEPKHTEMLYNDLLKWGSEDFFNQEAVVYKPYDSENAYVIGTSDVNLDTNRPFDMGKGSKFSIGKFTVKKIGDIYSQLRSGKKFAFAEMENSKSFVSKLVKNKMMKENWSNNQGGYWVKGNKIYNLNGRTHIDFVFANLDKFDMTREDINAYYKKHNEKLGQEGKAREEIILELVKKGWIRIRKYNVMGTEYWSIGFDYWRRRKKTVINFVLWAISEGVMKENETLIVKSYIESWGKKFDYKDGGAKLILDENEKYLKKNLIEFILK